jgi:hypothetical protein
MPTGKEGSTLTAELNRLAGITDITKYQDAQGAANRLGWYNWQSNHWCT